MPVHLYDVGPVLKQHVTATVTVAYRVYTHAHNTLTVTQPCRHGYTQQTDFFKTADFLVIQGT